MLNMRKRKLAIASVMRAIRLTHAQDATRDSVKPKARFVFEPTHLNGHVAKLLYRTEQDILHELLYPADFK